MVLAFGLNQNSCPCVLVTGITKAITLSEIMKGPLWDQERVSLSVSSQPCLLSMNGSIQGPYTQNLYLGNPWAGCPLLG